jgi:hypothetical protein
MKTNYTNGFAVTALVLLCAGLPAVSGSIDKQVPVNRNTIVTKADLPGKSTLMARNSAVRSEAPATTAAPAKTQNTHDKKAVGRCWSRLMGMFREINLAHRTRTK